MFALVAGGAVLGLTYAFARIPLPDDIKLPSSAEVFDVNGKRIGSYFDEVRRYIVDTDKFPEYIGEAVIAAEDRDFYDHSGYSLRGIMRAGWANVTGGEIQQGGSTITQQYVKQAVLRDPSRTVTRKLKELVLAIKLERRYDKEQILSFYLNTIYLGRGAYGFEAAARTYFGYSPGAERTAAEQLTLSQAAYLAGIVPAPESYQPDDNPEGAIARRDRTLDIMVAEGYITQAEADEAKQEEIKIAKGALGSVVKRQRAAYFLEWLRRDFLYPRFKEELFTRGLKIYTTLDLDAQRAAEEAIATHLPNENDPQAALVSMTPRGEVRALIGGRDFTSVKKARGFDFATDFPGRHAGSAFKPFTLLTAIEEDVSMQSTFSGATPRIVTDEECETNGEPWEVENFEGGSYGTIDLQSATTSSVNTVYAQLIANIGANKVAETVEDFGFEPKQGEDEIPAICSLSLGAYDVTPLEMGRAYAGFAGRGALPEVMPIRYIEDSEGECIVEFRRTRGVECGDEEIVAPDQVAERNDVDVLNQVMTQVVTGGTATAANIGRPVAGKTGTAQKHANAWFGGHTPQLATVVWLGYPLEKRVTDEPCDGDELPGECKKRFKVESYTPLMEYCSDVELCRPVVGDLGYPINVTGGSFPARIWATYMTAATADMEPLPFPTPTDLPDEIINSPPPASPAPAPTQTAEEEEPTPEPEPTETQPAPEPTQSDRPNPLPTQSHGPDP